MNREITNQEFEEVILSLLDKGFIEASQEEQEIVLNLTEFGRVILESGMGE